MYLVTPNGELFRGGEVSNIDRIYTGVAKIPPHSETNVSKATYETPDWKIISATAGTKSAFTNVTSSTSASITASNRVYVYEYKGTPFEVSKLHPLLTAGNDSSYPDTFTTNFVKLENVNNKTRMTVSVTRNDLLSNASPGSNWAGSFNLNILLIQID